MLTEQLTNRQDLVQSLDSDAILDYLLQHGVLDEASCDNILQENNREQRNTALLHHLELIGSSAIGLFINALRQSGQLTLASSLDKHRIKPTYGKGYLEKQRHKGQITLNIQVDAIKAVFPKWEEGDSFEEKHGDTPEKERKLSCFDGLLRTPRRMHKSYADMTLIDDPENFMSPKSRKKLDYSYESEPETDDEQRKGFCFCLCVPRKKKRLKPSNKTQQKYVDKKNRSANDELLMKVLKQPHSSQTPITSTPSSQNIYTDYRLVKSDKKQGTGAETSEQKRTKSPLRDISNERRGDSKNRRDSPFKNKHDAGALPKMQSKTNSHVNKSDNKENSTSSMKKSGYKGSVQNSDANISCDSLKLENLEPIEHCVMWKKRGPTFDGYEQNFYDILKTKHHLEIVKYFEQIRGTLVLHIYTENGLIIGTISMTIAQLKSLKKEIDNGQILCLLEKWLLSQQINDEIGVSEMKLKIVIDDNEFDLAYDELQ
ncbi:uncharacterized protein LOC127720613 [Mytilus californianus]|uniref:uncharacterized protein LOC127720613 n=1 Tax=Mytilus californianus TaxID=6549 RepID=UPI002248540B|nr:uncharacterized protein LOC127720613 [Mytilus californianus]XP_052083255.1 uncharacterized protein LOC127720613 [Mytilus californianus]XP_052083256.1 uncharacterized protein LOC127720613 [Mytilus californianus]